jgi:hypothetical protein
VTHWQQFQTIWHTVAKEKAWHLYPPIYVRFNKAEHYDFSFCFFFKVYSVFPASIYWRNHAHFATIGVADQSCRVYNLNLQILFCRFCSSFGAHCLLICRKMIRCAFLYCNNSSRLVRRTCSLEAYHRLYLKKSPIQYMY